MKATERMLWIVPCGFDSAVPANLAMPDLPGSVIQHRLPRDLAAIGTEQRRIRVAPPEREVHTATGRTEHGEVEDEVDDRRATIQSGTEEIIILSFEQVPCQYPAPFAKVTRVARSP